MTTQVTRLQDYEVRLDGSLDEIYRTAMQMRADGVLEHVASAPIERADGLFSLQVVVTRAPVTAPPESAPESPSPEPAFSAPAPVSFRPSRAVLALAAMVLAGCGALVALAVGISLGVSWIAAHLLPSVPMGLGIAALLVVSWRVSGIVSPPKPAPTPLSAPQSPIAPRTEPLAPQPPVPVSAPPEPAPERSQRRSWLTGRVISESVSAPEQAPAEASVIAQRWLAVLKDPSTQQSFGMWSGHPDYLSLADIEYGGDVAQAVFAHWDDRCAVAHLYNIIEPGHDRYGRKGNKHPAHDKANELYGAPFIKSVVRMNDAGYSLRKIARQVEPQLRKMGHLP